MVGLEEEIIDKDFRQSYWLALQFWVQPNRIFTVGVPQASHGITHFLKWFSTGVDVLTPNTSPLDPVSSQFFHPFPKQGACAIPSVFEFSSKYVTSSFEELIKIKVLFILRQGMFR